MADEFREHGVTVDRVEKRGGLDPTLIPRLVSRCAATARTWFHTHNPLPLIYGAPAARLVRAVAIHTKRRQARPGRADSSRAPGDRTLLVARLSRLGVDHIDIYRADRASSPAVPIEDTIGAIADMVKAGYVRLHRRSRRSASDVIRRRPRRSHPNR